MSVWQLSSSRHHPKLLLFCLSVLLISCTGTEPPSLDSVTDLYLPARPQPGKVAHPARVEVYIDGSSPMRNFVNGSATNRTTYSELLRYIGANPWGQAATGWYKFGEGDPVSIDGDQRRGMTKPAGDKSFYDQQWTHLGELVRYFRQHPAPAPGTVRIVVTDLVQANERSAEEPDQSNWAYLTNEIRAFQRSGDFQLIALRSAYSGIHSPESGCSKFRLAHAVERPFYILLFSPDSTLAEATVTAILKGQGTERWRSMAKRFRPGLQMGQLSWYDKYVPDRLPPDRFLKNPLINRDKVLNGQFLELHWTGIEDFHQPGLVRLMVRASTALPDECFIDINRPEIQLTLSCFHWHGPQADSVVAWSDSLAIETGMVQLRPSPEDTVRQRFDREHLLEWTLHAGRDMKADDYYIYRFECRADPTSLHLPDWCTAWSTDDDCDPANIERTLNLDKILGNIMRNTNADNPLLIGCLAIKGI